MALVLALGFGARPAEAQGVLVRADSTASRADSAGVGADRLGERDSTSASSQTREAAADTTRSRFEIVTSTPDSSEAEAERVLREAAARRRARARTPITLGRFDAPRWVMLRSALVPGWGQLHNGSWIKALGIAAGEVAFGIEMLKDERDLDRLSRLADEAQAANDEEAFAVAVNAYNARLDESTNRRWLFGGLLAYALVDAYVDAHFANFNVEFDTAPPAAGGTSDSGARLRLGWSF